MSARDVIAKAIFRAGNKRGQSECELYANIAIAALTASGYRILGPDELDAVTVEKCAEVAEERAEWVPLKAGDMRTAIRALCATHQGDK